MNRALRGVSVCCVLLVASIFAACGGGGSGPTLTLSAMGSANPALDYGQSIAITATTNSAQGVTWSSPSAGTLTNQTTTSATYTAPAGPDTSVTITATLVSDTSKTASITVKVTAPPSITTTSLPNGVMGTAYSGGQIAATEGAAPLSYAVSVGSLPAGLSLNSSSGAITGTPTGPASTTPVSFTVKVTDSSTVAPQSATKALSITVSQAPSISSANKTSFVVGANGSFTVTATGVPTPALSETGALPSGVTFTDNGNGTGTLSGTPAAGTAANYSITFTANNNVGTAASQSFTLTVGQPPAVTSAASTTFTVGAAGTFNITTSGFPAPSLTESGALPTGVTFKDNGNGTATLSGTPAAGTGKQYSLTITASNGVSPNASQTFSLTVDQTPAITSANSDNFVVNTASTFAVTTSGFPTPSIGESGTLPTGVTFVDNANGTGTLSGIPTTTGSYPITFTPSNGVGSPAAQNFTLTVGQAPAITSANNSTWTVGTPAGFNVTTTGFPAPSITISAGTLPAGLTFTDNGNGTATIASAPSPGTGGVSTITLKAQNSFGSTTQTFTITIREAPNVTSLNNATFSVGGAGTFTVTTNGYPVAAISESGSLPSGVGFVDNGNGTATLSGTPASGTNGSYTITITANNGVAPNGTQTFTLTVDTAPVITSANTATFTVGTSGTTFTVTATGTPAPSLSISSGTLPNNLTFTDNGNGTGTLAGTPAAGTGKAYAITFKATNSSGSSTQAFTLTVDQAPQITSANTATFTEGASMSFTVTTSGFPVSTISTASTFPSGVGLVDNGNGTATISGMPASGTASGSPYTINLVANNGVNPNGTQTFTLNVNAAPVFTSATSTTFTVGTTGTFTVAASGNPTPSFSTTSSLPSGVTLADNANGTATLSGNPATGTGGVYNITIKATSTSGTTNQSFTLTVDEAPGISSNSSATFFLNVNNTFQVQASGYPKTGMTITEAGLLPTGVTWVDNGNGSGTLSGMPTSTTGSPFSLTFTPNNGVGTPSSQIFTLTVSSDPCASFSSGSETLLNGSYAFVLKGFDNGLGSGETMPEPAAVGGVLTFNGSTTSPSVTGGALDLNLNGTAGVDSLTVSSGSTYKVGSDHRACMTLNLSDGTTEHYAVSLGSISSGVASIGHMIDWDSSGPYTTGELHKQTATTISAGTYVFQISSPQNTTPSAGEIQTATGIIKLSSGNVTGGEFDVNDGGNLDGSSTATSWSSVSPLTFNTTGSTYSTSNNGRGTLIVNVTVNGTAQTFTDTVYAVSSTEFLILTNFDQTQTGGLFGAGEALQRSGSMTNAILNGKSVLYSSSLQLNGGYGSTNPPTSKTQIGVVNTNGSVTSPSFSFSGYQNGNGSVSTSSASGTYSVDANGRVLLTQTGGGGGSTPLFYVISSNQAFFLGASPSVETGRLQPQAATSASGTFAVGQIDPADSNSGVSNAVVTLSGGSVTGTSDNNGSGSGPNTNPISGGFSIDGTGFGQVNSGTPCAATSSNCQFLFYVISSTSAVGMDGSGNNPSIQPVDQ